MSKEIDLSQYEIRTDMVLEEIESKIPKKGIISQVEEINDMKITRVDVLKEGVSLINKKEGKYITIEFEDVTDSENKDVLRKVFIKELKKMLKYLKIKDKDTCLIIGLGNNKSTPDSLGPLVIERLLVTKHLFSLGEVETGYRNVSAFSPGVMGQTGIETSEMILGIIQKIRPDFLIVVDALASNSISRINKTIQMTDTGIHPGSGVGNARKEISFEILKIPVIAIGIPTVVDAVTIVSDTINYMMKKFAYNKENLDDPSNKLIPFWKLDYLKKEKELSNQEKKNLMGLIGTLSENEIKQLVYEVLNPIGYNMMVTPKEIDFLLEKLSQVIACGLNETLHQKT
ncbi:MAG: GPR endopeptidase [Bacilli bacterium]|jgi:spore protease